MIRRVLKLASTLFLVGVFSAPGSALALPVANVSNAPLLPVEVGQIVTFDGSASICDFPPCRYIWSWFYPSGITGGQMGEGQIIDYAFPSSAAGRTVAVVIKVVDNTKTHGFSTTTVRVVVMPTDPTTTPPVATPPAQAPPTPEPVVTPPVVVPPVVTPPVVIPPDVVPPVVVPPVVVPPVVEPPVVEPPAVVPPVVTPADPTPPVATPPAATPTPRPVRHGGHGGKRGA
jgi:hypothetical protein